MSYQPTVDPALLSETDEQRQLAEVIGELMTQTGDPAQLAAQLASPGGYDPGLWRRLAGEIGVHGLAVPEEYGGAGYTFAELAVVFRETGRVLCPAPLLPTLVLGGYALLLGGDRAAGERFLPRIADGTLTATAAGLLHASRVTAERGAAGWVLRGPADFVPDGADAGLIVVAARTPDGTRLFACEPDPATCRRTDRVVLDATRRQALVEFRGAPAVPVGDAADTGHVIGAVRDLALAAAAAEHVGGCGHALEATRSYVLERRQFGQPIGSFQAVRHRLADLLVAVEAARSAAALATACAAGDPAGLPVAARTAAVVCSAAYRQATEEYVQLHGGIGFTWEHPAHRYLRRARGDEALFGTPDDHRARLAELLALTGQPGA